MAEDYSYERRIVCFIDILGFSNIIKSTRKGEDEKNNLKNICCALNMIDNYRCGMRKEIDLKDIQTNL